MRILVPNLPSSHLSTWVRISSAGKLKSYSCFSTPTFFTSSSCNFIAGCIVFRANSRALATSSSLASSAPASTIIMASLVPATTKSNLALASLSAWAKISNLPSIRPTRRPATGPSNGAPASIKAVLVAIRAIISGRKVGSILKTVAMP